MGTLKSLTSKKSARPSYQPNITVINYKFTSIINESFKTSMTQLAQFCSTNLTLSYTPTKYFHEHTSQSQIRKSHRNAAKQYKKKKYTGNVSTPTHQQLNKCTIMPSNLSQVYQCTINVEYSRL